MMCQSTGGGEAVEELGMMRAKLVLNLNRTPKSCMNSKCLLETST